MKKHPRDPKAKKLQLLATTIARLDERGLAQAAGGSLGCYNTKRVTEPTTAA